MIILGMFSGLAWSLKEMTSGGTGDTFQQGGSFVFQPDGSITFQVPFF